ncbi:hypothetical protein J4219_06410 [Candidatus Woesearchaeota archaeon]|nr:hypothetical protein [Candidatus Woesearchaeota archaeon]
MSFSRILGFSAITTLLALAVVAPSFVPVSLPIFFVLILVAGFANTQFFGNTTTEDQVETASILFLMLSAIAIVLGATTNVFQSLNSRATYFELPLLFLGLFAPVYVQARLHKHHFPLAPLAYNLASAAVIYLAILGINLLIGGIA